MLDRKAGENSALVQFVLVIHLNHSEGTLLNLDPEVCNTQTYVIDDEKGNQKVAGEPALELFLDSVSDSP